MFFTVILLLPILLYFVNVQSAPISNDPNKWSKSTLTYASKNYPQSLTKNDTLAAYRYAFDQWSKIVPKTFIEIPWDESNPADIRFSYEVGQTGLSSNGSIIQSVDLKWKKYKPGEKAEKYDPSFESDLSKPDITRNIMAGIYTIFKWNKVIEDNTYDITDDFDSNRKFVPPTIFKINKT